MCAGWPAGEAFLVPAEERAAARRLRVCRRRVFTVCAARWPGPGPSTVGASAPRGRASALPP